MSEIKYEIIKNIGVLFKTDQGWAKELNLVSWNDLEPKYDIRDMVAGSRENGQGRDAVEGRIVGTERVTE